MSQLEQFDVFSERYISVSFISMQLDVLLRLFP